MSKGRHNKTQDTSWIWLLAIVGVCFVLFVTLLACGSLRHGQATTRLTPARATQPYQPSTLRSLIVNPESKVNYFDFLLDTGDIKLSDETQLKPKVRSLINYFFLGITLPPDEFWVNLNPIQPERIVSPRLGITDMGKVLLEADLQLKKDSSKLTDPRTSIGKEYWQRLNEKLQKQHLTTTQVPTSTRVWIIPGKAKIQRDGDKITIVEAKLKVCLESEYLSRQGYNSPNQAIEDCSSVAFKEVILPKLEEEVNFGKNYAPLRQVYNSLILAQCYKQRYHNKNNFYSQSIHKAHLVGLCSEDDWEKDKYFQAYLSSHKQGEYSFSRQEYDPAYLDLVRRRYFSGGIRLNLFEELRVEEVKIASSAVVGQEQSLAIEEDLILVSTFTGDVIAYNRQDFAKYWNPEIRFSSPASASSADKIPTMLAKAQTSLPSPLGGIDFGGIVGPVSSPAEKEGVDGRYFNWNTRGVAINNIKDTIGHEKPEIMRAYKKIYKLSPEQIEALKRDIYHINSGHFKRWGLGNIFNRKVVPYFNGSYIEALIAVFAELDLNPLEFQLDCSTENRAIESIHYVFSKKIPHIMQRYNALDKLSPSEIESLRSDIYKITAGHFKIWGLSNMLDQRRTPYFQGSHINVLRKIFTNLKLNPLGFKLDHSTRKRSIESIRYVFSKEIPGIMQKYARRNKLSPQQINALKDEIYKITDGHLDAWGLGQLPHFSGYSEALIAVFAELDLNPLGFRLNWSTKEKGIESIRYVFSKEIPHIMQRYNALDKLNPSQIEALRDDICKITQGYFRVWGLGSALHRTVAPYFNGSYIEALIAVFNDPRLNLDELTIKEFRKIHRVRLYTWKEGEDKCIDNIKHGLMLHIPHIIEKYNKIDKLLPHEKESLRNNIYNITVGHFSLWRLSAALNSKTVPYFNGSHINVLRKIFPKLNLNPLGFRLDYSTRKRSIESIRYVFSKEIPGIMQKYARRNKLSPQQINALKDEIYKITDGHFKIWRLSGVLDQRNVPYFNGSYIEALIAVFADLELNRLGFQLDWSTKEKGIESIRYVFSKEIPHIMQRYNALDKLSPSEIESLRSDIYKIGSGHFYVWGLSGVIDKTNAPYFNGSYIEALIAVFADLELNRLGFQLDWSTKEKGIKSVHYVFYKKIPHIMQRYNALDKLSPSEIESLRSDIYKIGSGHFYVWGLGAALNKDYFNGSYINISLTIFSDQRLALQREGFLLYNSSSPVQEDELKPSSPAQPDGIDFKGIGEEIEPVSSPAEEKNKLGKSAQAYIKKYYSDRVYMGDYEGDRIRLLERLEREGKIVRLSSLPSPKKVFNPRRKKPGLLTNWRLSRLRDRPVVSRYSPLDGLPSRTLLEVKEEPKHHADGGTYMYFADGDRFDTYFSAPWSLSYYRIAKLFEPYFNIPRSRNNMKARGRMLIDLDIDPEAYKHLTDEEIDLLEMLPIKDRTRSFLSCSLLRFWCNDSDSFVGIHLYEPNSKQEGSSMKDSFERGDGTFYIWDLDPRGFGIIHDLALVGGPSKLDHIEGIATYIESMPKKLQRDAIRYVAETVLFISSIDNFSKYSEAFIFNVSTVLEEWYPWLYKIYREEMEQIKPQFDDEAGSRNGESPIVPGEDTPTGPASSPLKEEAEALSPGGIDLRNMRIDLR